MGPCKTPPPRTPPHAALHCPCRLFGRKARPMPDPSLPEVAAHPTAPASLSPQNLAMYELQKPFVEPMLRMFRLTNTALDVLFYDVGVLTAALLEKGTAIDTGAASRSGSSAQPLQTLDLTAA